MSGTSGLSGSNSRRLLREEDEIALAIQASLADQQRRHGGAASLAGPGGTPRLFGRGRGEGGTGSRQERGHVENRGDQGRGPGGRG